jgi:DNA polymerase elongation subunit (family B)
MDIETFLKDGVHIPYVITWYDGKNIFSYYLTNFKSSNEMIIQTFKDLMVKKYDNYKIYIHNLSGFDGIFLLKILAELGSVKPIIHHGDLISIDFKFKGYNIIFRDSQQLLITSLRSLGKVFAVETQKSIFPYRFVNENNLNYIGSLPDFKYFDKISSLDYNCYIENYNNWNMKEESIKYCEIDSMCLYQILDKFSNMIFELFEINLHKYPTLSSLAFAIFRTHFLKKNEIPQLSGQIAKDIRQSYTGGAVDMYIPKSKKGSKIYAYDVNSLYPFVMDNFEMPIGNPTLFYGDIRKVDPNAFGFFYCKIKAPDNLKHPILQTHVKINKTLRTIAPLGEWSDIIFSAEMDNAIKFGYKFEILWGYTFNRKYIFKGFVSSLYNLRLKWPKGHPLNLIAKLLLNSLYGRFGMDDQFSTITIFNNFKEFKKWFEIYNDDVENFIELGDKVLVQHRSEMLNQKTDLYGNLETHNVSICIAAAITAYARMHMSQFKNNLDYNLYYTDTDSIYIDKPLPDDLVDNKKTR